MVGYAYDKSLAKVSNMMADSHSKLLYCQTEEYLGIKGRTAVESS